MVGRQEVQRALGAVEQTLAKKTSRADGNYRLDNVPARAAWIRIGIEKDQDAGELVGFDDPDPALGDMKQLPRQYNQVPMAIRICLALPLATYHIVKRVR